LRLPVPRSRAGDPPWKRSSSVGPAHPAVQARAVRQDPAGRPGRPGLRAPRDRPAPRASPVRPAQAESPEPRAPPERRGSRASPALRVPAALRVRRARAASPARPGPREPSAARAVRRSPLRAGLRPAKGAAAETCANRAATSSTAASPESLVRHVQATPYARRRGRGRSAFAKRRRPARRTAKGAATRTTNAKPVFSTRNADRTAPPVSIAWRSRRRRRATRIRSRAHARTSRTSARRPIWAAPAM